MGQLRNKCVRDYSLPEIPTDVDADDLSTAELFENTMGRTRNWTEWILNEDNWYFNEDSGEPELCGNASGARPCPSGYICLPHVGDNPNYGFTSFDNLLWSMLTTFQLITLDYWENVYNMVRKTDNFFDVWTGNCNFYTFSYKIVATGGPMSVVFFTIVVFFGSFYLINLMLAVVAMSYEEEAEANIAVSSNHFILCALYVSVFQPQEREKEANEIKAYTTEYQPRGEECTIRTNSQQLYANGGGSSISDDMCGKCSKNSREALQRAGQSEGKTESGFEGIWDGTIC